MVVVQSVSRVQFFATPWTAACQGSLSFIVSQSSLKLKSIELEMPSNHLILCRPLLFLQSFPASGSFPIPQFKIINSSALSFLYGPTLRSIQETTALTIKAFVGKVMSLLFNMLSRFIMAFLPRSKHVLISWLQSPSAVILEPKKMKSLTVSIASPSLCHEMMELDAMILVFWMLSFKSAFKLSSFTYISGSLVLLFLP